MPCKCCQPCDDCTTPCCGEANPVTGGECCGGEWKTGVGQCCDGVWYEGEGSCCPTMVERYLFTVTTTSYTTAAPPASPVPFHYGTGATGRVTAPGGSSANQGPITAVEVLTGGSGYAKLGRVAPTLSISGGSGTGATFTPTLQQFQEGFAFVGRPDFWKISSVAVSGGSGYEDLESLTVSAASGDVTAVPASVIVATKDAEPTLSASVSSGVGGALSVSVQPLSPSSNWWYVSAVTVSQSGSGYTDGESVVFSLGQGDEQYSAASAKITTNASGAIQSVSLGGGLYPGGLYRKKGVPWAVWFTGNNLSPGKYYREDPAVAPYVGEVWGVVPLIGAGSGAVLSAVIDDDTSSATFGQVTAFNVVNGGTGYLGWDWVVEPRWHPASEEGECCGIWRTDIGDCCLGAWFPSQNGESPPDTSATPFVPVAWASPACPGGSVYARWGQSGECCGCLPATIYDRRIGDSRPIGEVLSDLCCPACGPNDGGLLPFGVNGENVGCVSRCCYQGASYNVTVAFCLENGGTPLPGCASLGCPIDCCSEVDCNVVCTPQVPSSQCAHPATVSPDWTFDGCESNFLFPDYGCLGACCVDGEYIGQKTQSWCLAIWNGCWSGLGSTSCQGVCLDGGECCESVQSTASGLTFTRPARQYNRCRNCGEITGTHRVTVTGTTDSPILIHGTPFGQVGKRCPINHSFLLCWQSFNIEPVPCDSDFIFLDVTVCWEDEATEEETLQFSGCNDISVHLGECDYDCATTLLYEGSGATSTAPITLHGNATIEANGTGALVLTGNITVNGSCVDKLTLTGTSTAANEVRVIQHSGLNDVHVEKRGVGLWRMNGASSYSGQLRVMDGTLVVASTVADSGGSAFGSNTADILLPVVGSSAAGATGTAALLLQGGAIIERGFSVASLGGGGANQVAVIGSTGSGSALFSGLALIKLGRSVTLQAAAGSAATFANGWADSNGNANPAVAYTVGSAGNDGIVSLSNFLSGSATGVSVVNGTARIEQDDVIASTTPVTVGSSLGPATLDLNGYSQTLSELSFAGNSGSVIGGTLRLAADPTVATVGSGHEITSAVALDDDATLSGGGTLRISGVVSGAYPITMDGGGIVELSGNNNYSGTTTINGGTMRAMHLHAFGTGAIIVNAGATLDKNGYALANTVTNNGGTVLP